MRNHKILLNYSITGVITKYAVVKCAMIMEHILRIIYTQRGKTIPNLVLTSVYPRCYAKGKAETTR